MTLGYKGRLLVSCPPAGDGAHRRPGRRRKPCGRRRCGDWLDAYASEFNAGRSQAFDQFQPSLRQVQTSTDAEMNDTVWVQAGIRLPLDFGAAKLPRPSELGGGRTGAERRTQRRGLVGRQCG